MRYVGSGVGETESSTIEGCSGLSRHRWEEVRKSEPDRMGSDWMRWRKDVRHSGEM